LKKKEKKRKEKKWYVITKVHTKRCRNTKQSKNSFNLARVREASKRGRGLFDLAVER